MPPTHDHPLLLPEILVRISSFVAPRDAISCAQVCTDWGDVFTSIVWQTIDFKAQQRFVSLTPAAIRKHGHRILTVKNIEHDLHVEALHHPSICKIRHLAVTMPSTARFQAYCHDLLRRNATSIVDLDIGALPPNGGGTVVPFPLDAFSMPIGGPATSKITFLKIQNLPMTRDGFSSLLRLCPALVTLNIRGTPTYVSNCLEPFQHAGLKELIAPLEQIFRPDYSAAYTQSLLAHFPQLVTLRTWSSSASSGLLFDHMKEQVARHCPLLTRLCTEAPAGITTTLLTQTFHSLTCITVSESNISETVVMAILSHQATLDRLYIYLPYGGYYEQDEVPVLQGNIPIPGWAIQLIPQTCHQLTTLQFPLFEMDMDGISKSKWSCKNLESLFIRIRGLDTKESIDEALQLWTEGVAKRESMKKLDATSGGLDFAKMCLQDPGVLGQALQDPLEERVARHLLQFEKLHTVWLGHKVTTINL